MHKLEEGKSDDHGEKDLGKQPIRNYSQTGDYSKVWNPTGRRFRLDRNSPKSLSDNAFSPKKEISMGNAFRALVEVETQGQVKNKEDKDQGDSGITDQENIYNTHNRDTKAKDTKIKESSMMNAEEDLSYFSSANLQQTSKEKVSLCCN